MQRSAVISGIILLGASLGVGPSRAASPAMDDAADPAYDDGWQPGDEGGSGWGDLGWQFSLSSTPADAFIGTATANGDGGSDMDGDIDTGGRSFGLFVEGNGAVALATRPIDGELLVGQAVSFDMGNDLGGGSPRVRLINNDGLVRLFFGCSSFQDSYEVSAADGFSLLGIPGTDEGVRVEITLTEGDG